MAAFSQSEFQNNLTDWIVRMWQSGSRNRGAAVKLHCGKAKRRLVRMGYRFAMADTLVEDCREMAQLIRDAE